VSDAGATIETAEPADAVMGVGRLEAFSDGVFAIAVTLLVLDVKVPRLDATDEGARLLAALLGQWPNYLAYVTSFATIFIMWVNHHVIFRSIRRADHALLLLNGLLLLCITFVPFPTALLAEYLGHQGQQTAAAVYSGTFVATAVAFNLLWRHAMRRERLLAPHVERGRARRFGRTYLAGPLFYFIAFVFAFVNVGISVAICVGLAILFALPTALGRPSAARGSPGR
jgi:uncharacterized membrane protein